MPKLKRSVPIEISALICLGTLLILGYALGSALPHGPWFRYDGIIGKSAAWDAQNYEQISLHGYRNGETTVPSPLIAFFPGWPLIESVLIAIAGSPQGRARLSDSVRWFCRNRFGRGLLRTCKVFVVPAGSVRCDGAL